MRRSVGRTFFRRFPAFTTPRKSFCAFNKEKLILDPSTFQKDLELSNDIIKKSPETELARYLKGTIRIRGPMTVSQYWREALTNEKYGYYKKKENIFGTEGDFITAPEISQMFGELIGIWVRQVFAEQYSARQGKVKVKSKRPSSFRIVEFGPGRGTLMSDLLRCVKNASTNGVKNIYVHFIETSPKLRSEQAKAVGCSEAVQNLVGDAATEGEMLRKGFKTAFPSIEVCWNSNLEEVPGTDPVYIIAQEFLDALPVNVFEFTKKGWRELLVDIDERPGGHHFRYLLSEGPSVSSISLYSHPKIALPKTFVPEEGQRVEVSLDRALIAESIGHVISERKGAALLIDYGNPYPSTGTVRACKQHKFADILCEPGHLDITSDVDFQSLRTVFERCVDEDGDPALNIFGAIKQGSFLKNMGIQHRLLKLLSDNREDPETLRELVLAYSRLTYEEEMGSVYKVMSVCPKGKKVCGFRHQGPKGVEYELDE